MNKNIIISAIVALVVGVIVGLVLVRQTSQSTLVGGLVHVSQEKFVQGISVGTTGQFTVSNAGVVLNTGSSKIGSTGSTISKIIFGTCNLWSTASTSIGSSVGGAVAATSSVIASCPVTGVVAGDKVFVSLSTSTPSTNFGWTVLGANASSTSGYIAVKLMNLTGGASDTSNVGTSTQYLIIR